jgi:hypothetical protein
MVQLMCQETGKPVDIAAEGAPGRRPGTEIDQGGAPVVTQSPSRGRRTSLSVEIATSSHAPHMVFPSPYEGAGQARHAFGGRQCAPF